MKRLIIGFGVLALGLGVLLALRLRAQARAEGAPPGSSGVVEGTRVVVASRIGARVGRLHAEEGDRVAAGDLLAELDCTEIDAAVAEADAHVASARAQVTSARAQVGSLSAQAQSAYRQAESQAAQIDSLKALSENAKRQAARTANLLGQNIATEADLDRARTGEQEITYRVTAAQAAAQAATLGATAIDRQAAAALAQVRGAEDQLAAAEASETRLRAQAAECRLLAPRAGIVTLRAHQPGEVVLPGSTLYEITDNDDLKITFYVANADLGRVAVGNRVTVVADAFPGERFGGAITRIAEEAEFTPRTVQTRSDRDRLVYAVEASVRNRSGRLRSGMPVEVTVVPASRR